MKRLLIISPYFPPSNAADMQRVRMSLPFFKDLGWAAEVVAVEEVYTDAVFDYLLLESVPAEVKVHHVKALKKSWTSKFGLGSIALRSLWHYRKYVDQLLKREKFDLIYFSTTQFPICILGAYWKKKFNIPFVIDMQDPWFSNYYEGKPSHQKPRKYWFSHRLDRQLEPIAMHAVDGLISVSEAYIEDLQYRYPSLKHKPASTITFGAFKPDVEIAFKHQQDLRIAFDKNPDFKHVLYVGRGGYDMQKAVSILFRAFDKGLKKEPEAFNILRFHFIGTSYAPLGQGEKTLQCVAEQMGLGQYAQEQSDRISFYESIYNLQLADALFIPGHQQAAYTASKIYPYILIEKPILGIFNASSSAGQILTACKAGVVADISNEEEAIEVAFEFLSRLVKGKLAKPEIDWAEFEQYQANTMTKKQVELFEKVVKNKN